MDKEELKTAVNELPLFEKKDIAIKEVQLSDEDFVDSQWNEEENWKAITEVGKLKPFAFVSKLYNLVQFKEIYLPILEKIDTDLKGSLHYWEGVSMMDIFPEDTAYSENGNQIGINIMNSVNLKSSVIIRFSIKDSQNRLITIPRKIAGFKRTHLNAKLLDITKTYIKVIAKVKDTWKTIIEKFPTFEIDKVTMKDMCNDLQLGDNMATKLKTKWAWAIANGKKYNLWDFFIDCIDYVGGRNYKSAIHKRNNVDKIVEKIIVYGFTLNL
jgi:hypothetical protein